MWKAFIMKADQPLLELIALKNAINEIEREITILEEQRQLTRHIQIGGQLAFDFQRDIGGVSEMTR
jgi:hypothetical protein